jgi:hypothetical protein
VASWFETHRFAMLLTMRVSDLILKSLTENAASIFRLFTNRLKMTPFFVMAGHSRPKDGVASARLRPGHPRLSCLSEARTWMPGTSPGMTSFAKGADFYWLHFESDSEEHRQRVARMRAR